MDVSTQKQLRDLSSDAAKKIPYVGSIAGPLVKVLWVVNEPSLWDQIKNEVEEFVDKKIVANNYAALSLRLAGYNKSLKYLENKSGKLQYEELNRLQHSILVDSPFFMSTTASDKAMSELLPLFTPMALLHVMVRNLIAGMSEQFESDPSNQLAFIQDYETLKESYVNYGEEKTATATKWRTELVVISRTESSGTFINGQKITTVHVKCEDTFKKKVIINADHTTNYDPFGAGKDMKTANNYKSDIEKKTRTYWDEQVTDVLKLWKGGYQLPTVDEIKERMKSIDYIKLKEKIAGNT
jgi:hypothetical protein